MIEKVRTTALALAVLLIPVQIHAQTDQRSAIEGVVTDPQGAVVRGVSVTLSGDRLIGGARSAATDALGRVRFVELLPGTYDLEVNAPGFKTARRSHIALPVETTYTIPIGLQMAGLVESVDVPANRALIDVRSAASPTIFDQPLLHDVPTSRTLDSVLGLTPGVTTPPPLYSIGGQVAFGGTQMSGNVIAVDGVGLNDPAIGQQVSEVHYNWLQQVQVSGLGAPAEYGTFTGALANGVLRSGGNRVSGMGEYLTVRPKWTANNLGGLPADEQDLLPPTTVLSWWDLNGQVGAPIVRDRLWVFGGTSALNHEYRSFGYSGPGHTDERTSRTLAKVDASPFRKLTLQGFVTRDATDTVGLGLSQWSTAEARPDTESRSHAWNLRGNVIVTPTTMLTVRASGYTGMNRAEPHPPATMDGPSPSSESTNGMACCNSFWNEFHRKSSVTALTATHYHEGRLGRHDMKAGFEYDVSPSEYTAGIPTGRRLTTENGVVVQVEEWAGDHPETTAKHAVVYLQDRWALNSRLTLEPGFRAEFNRGTVPGATHTFSTSPVGLRLGLAWDVSGNQTTVARAHYGRYHDPLYSDVYAYTAHGVHSPHVFYAVQDGQLIEQFHYVEEVDLTEPSTLKQSHVDQWTAGVEHALGSDTTVQVQWVGRRFGHFIGWVDPRLSDWTPHQVQDPGPDGTPGTSDDGGMFTVYQVYPNSGFSDRLELSNPAGAYRRYNGIQIVATRRYANRWQYQVSYSWSRSSGTAGNEYATDATYWSMNPAGYGADGNMHASGPVPPIYDYSEFKAVGSYRAPWLGGWMTGAAFRWHDGTHWQRVARVAEPFFVRFPAEPVGTRRTPSIGGLDLRVEKTFGLPRDGRLGFYVDIFNLTNVGRATGYNPVSGPNFQKVEAWTDPRTGQLGVRYSF